MTEEPEFPFDGLDADRPLPPELRARLEAALLAAVAGGLPVAADARGLHQPPGTHQESLDAPRPLPEALRTRLESALLAEAVAASPAAAPAASAGAATSSPTAAAAASSATVPEEAAASTTPAPAGEVVSLAGRRRKAVAAWSSVAAVLLLVVMVAGLAGRGGNSGSGSLEAAGGPTTTTVGAPAPLPSDAGASTGVTSPATTVPAAASPTTRVTRPRPSPSTTGPQAPGAGTTKTPEPTSPADPTSPGPSGGAPAPVTTDPGPAPPFYNSPAPGDSAGGAPAMTSGPPSAASPSEGGSQDAAPPSQPQRSATPAPAGPALRVGIITGDAAQEAGFRAYIHRLNEDGGVGGHPIELVRVTPGTAAADTVATVNLGSRPVAGPGGAPRWVTGPLLETLTATEDLLTGNGAVFSFAGAPERQGHLAADALFPSDAAAGTKAVIYVPAAAGPLRDAVPAAIESVLKQRNITNVQVVTYDPAHKLTPADAAFVSLDPSAARAWVAQAKAEGYRPAGGVAGIYSLADDTLAADLPEGARVVSPYVVPAGDEGQAIRSAGAGTSASVLHGWATAKSLAAALWRTGADAPAEVQAALEGLKGWSSGLAPAYETRPGTRSRIPEGVIFQVQSGAFVAQGGFRRDPYPIQ